jgi:anti-anti-sigma factor
VLEYLRVFQHVGFFFDLGFDPIGKGMRFPRKASIMTRDPHRGRWQVTPDQHADGTVVIFTGHARQAATAADVVLGQQLARIVDEQTEGNLYLDFRNVEFLNSDDIARLVRLWKKLKDDGRRLVLCNIKPLVYQVFQIIRLNKLMETREERAFFCDAAKREAPRNY